MEEEINVIKAVECSTVSGRSNIVYEFGAQEGKKGLAHLQFRIASNSGGGMFGKAWVPMGSVVAVLKDPELRESIGAASFRPIFAGRSINTQSFLLAALINEGVIVAHPTKARAYQVFEVTAFEKRLRALFEVPASSDPEDGSPEKALPAKPLPKKPSAKGSRKKAAVAAD